MDTRRRKIHDEKMEAQVTIRNIRSEINLEGLELLRLEFGKPGIQVMCTSGTLWLTQQDDLHDHLLEAGRSFTLTQRGTILVQGLPCGKARIFNNKI